MGGAYLHHVITLRIWKQLGDELVRGSDRVSSHGWRPYLDTRCVNLSVPHLATYVENLLHFIVYETQPGRAINQLVNVAFSDAPSRTRRAASTACKLFVTASVKFSYV
jgi:hypothetical protein